MDISTDSGTPSPPPVPILIPSTYLSTSANVKIPGKRGRARTLARPLLPTSNTNLQQKPQLPLFRYKILRRIEKDDPLPPTPKIADASQKNYFLETAAVTPVSSTSKNIEASQPGVVPETRLSTHVSLISKEADDSQKENVSTPISSAPISSSESKNVEVSQGKDVPEPTLTAPAPSVAISEDAADKLAVNLKDLENLRLLYQLNPKLFRMALQKPLKNENGLVVAIVL